MPFRLISLELSGCINRLNRMKRSIASLLFWTLVLCACSPSPNIASPTALVAADPTSTSIPITDVATVVSPTDASSSVNLCGYQWAYNDLPELTAQFDQSVKNIIPNSKSHATAFGENCIGNDGQVVQFLTMQTDFYVLVTVESLDEYETFGNWIAGVMQVVEVFPDDVIPGPMPGFVAFQFEKSTTETFGIRIPIQQYRETGQGKTGQELFNLFYTKP
jgi:hypothetical protein